MANDASAVPAIAREIGKKKRANRSAKLKQCKLDARRDQWLSQVKNKECKDKTTGTGTSPTTPPQRILEKSAEKERHHWAAAASPEHDGSCLQVSNNADFLTHSPTHHPSGNLSRNECPMNKSISSSGSSIGSCSRSVSDDEDNKEETEERGGGGLDDDKEGTEETGGCCLDDWEAIADALSMSPNNAQDHHPKSAVHATTVVTRNSEPIKQAPDRTIPRAWRSDDIFRPQSLPNLSKQKSFPVNMERHFGAHLNHRGTLPPPPSSCPICYEDLDITDSSFLPCSCGFRLCLFCHKRILEADGRCPGCRKQYNCMTSTKVADVITEAWVPPMAYRLSRSYSLSSRS